MSKSKHTPGPRECRVCGGARSIDPIDARCPACGGTGVERISPAGHHWTCRAWVDGFYCDCDARAAGGLSHGR